MASGAFAGVIVKRRKRMTTHTIKQKMSGTGSIHDIESDQYDREIRFPAGAIYAVVLASYYGGRGYSTHRTEEAAIRAADRQADYTLCIIDATGSGYIIGDGYYRGDICRCLMPV